ncbi:hypothetical protein [Pseudomonas syringae]|uniref:hypothetical protein n=1 Tax=Pseudomonas syringae TaxID=317 RepID=UPI0009B172F4|nr:hypothetical protein [Pseudomonas syringae]MDY2562507.1 hypothetical protein [Pseudomonas syringae]PBP30977.1 hypothetical protein CCL11_28880 [Pseudomonas syringae]RXT59561.1 hypothetical protein B1F74_28330 [Pseudomonas syringae]
MKRLLKYLAISITAILSAFFVARTAIASGLVKSVLETAAGREINLTLRQFFGVVGAEEGETLIISVVFITSLILVIILLRLLSTLIKKLSKHNLKK